MGVPKFFRYTSERYPCLSELVKEFQIPDFDNLYLDMNGIIHSCSHPNDLDLHFSITEEKIFASIFHYIEVLFNIIKPRRLFFMAVDGVAPRAKMNQQRARRFKSIKDLETAEKKLIAQGEKPMPKDRFDSNAITPGTVFMDRLHAQLKYFITSKISTDPLWQGCKVILSGHQTPGEGEHKIMDYIRYLKTLPDYDVNTRHCLYGLDADLILLGLCTHEPHFSLLRQKVQFGRKQTKKILSPDETEFYLLHLSLMREYLDMEFQELKEALPFEYNLEKIIDDWVLMSFLVGNDFIPNLPGLHINAGALPLLYSVYKEVLPSLDGYFNENGYLNLPRFQKYMEKLGEHDIKNFEETFANLQFLEEKMGKSKGNGEAPRSTELEELINLTKELFFESDKESVDDEDDDTFLSEFCQHKKNYYADKLDCGTVTDEVLQSQAEGYIRAIQWNLHYYYQGCQSWSWYYPHHYSPYVSDIINFKDLKLDFDMGKPFLPFEQLLAVLPAGSKNLLPEAYRDLMTSPNSPVKDFYPEDFETDLNGKQHEWEAVVLIPFINEERLLAAMEPYNDKLSFEERKRNTHGPMTIYMYTEQDLGLYKAPQYFPSIAANHALAEDVFREDIAVNISDLRYGLRPGVLLDVLCPGFPTFRHIPHTASLKYCKVKVFDFQSRGENMVVTVKSREFPAIQDLAENLLGKIVYVNWPHLVESRVVAIADGNKKLEWTSDERIVLETMDDAAKARWMGVRQSVAENYLNRLGVEIGSTNIIVYVSTLEGRKYSFGPMGKITDEKIWSSIITAAPMQTIVRDVPVHNFRARTYADFRDAFQVGSVVFMLGQPHFGSMGRVLDSSECSSNGRLKVAMELVKDPVIAEEIFKSRSKISYFPCRVAATKVGISPRLLSRITGSVLVEWSNGPESSKEFGSKINIGLNLKFNKKNEEFTGYTKKKNEGWMYSTKAVDLVSEYVEKFSRVLERLSNSPDTHCFLVEDVFPGSQGIAEMKEMVNWIKEQEYNKVERIRCGTELMETETVSELEKMLDNFTGERFCRTMQVKPHLLYKSDLVFGSLPPVKYAKHQLLDRVVAVKSSCTVPAGLRGFIIGIHKAPVEADCLYDILFDKPFVGGMTINSSPERAFRMSRSFFINITDANRISQSKLTPNFQSVNTMLRPSNGEPKTSAFAQWNHTPPRPLIATNDDHFKRMWSDMQSLKPQEGTTALKKLLKIEDKEKPTIEGPVKSFFEKMTKVNVPRAEEVKTVQDLGKPLSNKYYIQLFSYYQRKNLGQPRFKYSKTSGKVTAQVHINDGRVYSGLPCDDKECACESAAFEVLRALGEIPPHDDPFVQVLEKDKKMRENQEKLSDALARARKTLPEGPSPATQTRPLRAPTRRADNGVPPSLPDPPSQWVGRSAASQNPPRLQDQDKVRPRPRGEFRDRAQDGKFSASALEFVPLQAIIGKRNYGNIATTQATSGAVSTRRPPEILPKPHVPFTASHSEASSSLAKPKRRPKIAASLDLDPNLY